MAAGSGTATATARGPAPAAGAGRDRGRNRLKPGLPVLEDRRLLSTFDVTSTMDTVTNGTPMTGTPRWAVGQADLATSPSTIDFSLGGGPQTITLSRLLAPIELSNTAESITITDCTITGGSSFYGGVFVAGRATITGSTIVDNASTSDGDSALGARRRDLQFGPAQGLHYPGTYTSASQLDGQSPLTGAPSSSGSYTVLASFPGTADYVAAQSAPVTFTIGRGTPSIALTTSGGSAVSGQSVTFAARVTAGASTPTGTITFLDGSTPIGTAARDVCDHRQLRRRRRRPRRDVGAGVGLGRQGEPAGRPGPAAGLQEEEGEREGAGDGDAERRQGHGDGQAQERPQGPDHDPVRRRRGLPLRPGEPDDADQTSLKSLARPMVALQSRGHAHAGVRTHTGRRGRHS